MNPDDTTEITPVQPDDTGEIPTAFYESPARWYWITLALGALAVMALALLYGFAQAARPPEEIEVPVHLPGEVKTVVSSYTETETEYVEDGLGPGAFQAPAPPPERVLVPVEVPAEGPPRIEYRDRIVERPVPGPTRTVTETKTVPGPTRTVTETKTVHEHHHHPAEKTS